MLCSTTPGVLVLGQNRTRLSLRYAGLEQPKSSMPNDARRIKEIRRVVMTCGGDGKPDFIPGGSLTVSPLFRTGWRGDGSPRTGGRKVDKESDGVDWRPGICLKFPRVFFTNFENGCAHDFSLRTPFRIHHTTCNQDRRKDRASGRGIHSTSPLVRAD